MDVDLDVTQRTPEETAEVLTDGLVRASQLLWVGGSILGPDRVSGKSKNGYGDDRVVGVAVVAEIAGQLAVGILDMLGRGNSYAGMALLRQLLEIEYLLWAFAHDDEGARRWLNAADDELWQMFRPQTLRNRASGIFRGEQYRVEVNVAPTTSAAILGDKVASGLLDHYLGRTGFDSQQQDRSIEPGRADNLWESVQSDLGAHGEFDDRAHEHSIPLVVDHQAAVGRTRTSLRSCPVPEAAVRSTELDMGLGPSPRRCTSSISNTDPLRGYGIY